MFMTVSVISIAAGNVSTHVLRWEYAAERSGTSDYSAFFPVYDSIVSIEKIPQHSLSEFADSLIYESETGDMLKSGN